MSKIIEMARQARLGAFHLDDGSTIEALEEFAALVGAAKKEECAKACEAQVETGAHRRCAAAIRALGDEVGE